MSRAAIEEKLITAKVERVAITSTSIVLWFDDKTRLQIEANIIETESLRSAKPRLYLDLIDAPKPIANFKLQCQPSSKHRWYDVADGKFDLQEEAEQTARKLYGHGPVRVIRISDGAVIAEYNDDNQDEAPKSIVNFKLQYQPSPDRCWYNVDGGENITSGEFELQEEAEQAAQKLYGHGPVRIIRVSDGAIVALYDNSKTIYNKIEGSNFKLQHQPAPDKYWYNVASGEFKLQEEAEQAAQKLYGYGQVKIIRVSDGAIIAMYNDGKAIYTKIEAVSDQDDSLNFKLQCRVASDEPWTDIENREFQFRDSAKLTAQALSKNSMVYGMVRVVDIRNNATIATYSGGMIV